MDAPEVPGLVLLRPITDTRAGQWRGPSAPPPGLSGLPSGPVEGHEVYHARRLGDGREVAVKLFARPMPVLRDQLRFEQEVSGLKALDGLAHVLTPISAGIDMRGRPFVATPVCPSGSLRDHLDTVGRFTPLEVRRIGAKIAAALAGAHQLGVVHRRVKPSNVLIDAAGEPQLSDFGLVSLALSDADQLATEDAQTVARAYAAPEAYLPELMTPAADIYSLGATLYTLLAGWSPRTDDPLAVVVDSDSVADLPKVPWALMSVVRRAIAMDPQERYPDAASFAAALATAG